MNAKTCNAVSRGLMLIVPLLILPVPLFAREDLVDTIKVHSEAVRAVTFSPDGKLLASGSNDNSICLWNVESHSLKAVFEGHIEAISSVAFSPDGKLLASGSYDRTIKLWDVGTRKLRLTLKEDGQYPSLPYTVAFSPDGRTLAASGGHDGTNFWNVANGTRITKKAGNYMYADPLAFTPDGKFLLKCDHSNRTARLDLATDKEVIIDSEPVTGTSSCLAISSDSKTLAVGGRKHSVTLFDLTTGVKKTTLKSDVIAPIFGGCGIPVDGLVYSVAFHPDGELLAMASYDCAIKLWNTKTGKQLESLKGHENMIWSVAFSSDGKLLASGSADNTVKIWKVSAEK